MHSSPLKASPRGTPSQRGKTPAGPSSTPKENGKVVANKFQTTFTTSLSIPVGSIPIDTSELPVPSKTATVPSEDGMVPKRAPRKSKTDALAAMHIDSNSEDEDVIMESQAAIWSREDGPSVPVPVPASFDLLSVRTERRRSEPKMVQPRPFGLEDCPTYYPTQSQFADQMLYIRSISKEAEKYGICKIVPPEGWHMPFVTDAKVTSS